VKLGTLLLRNAAIGLSQLEAALRNQVLYGGRLGTNLVELGHLDLETLSTMLAELTGNPVATPSQLDAADRGLLEQLGGDDAHRLRALPLTAYVEKQAIGVAMVDPTDKAAIAELATRFGKKVAPHVVPELRALYYLEKHYGLPRRARFVRAGQRESDEPPAPPVAERRRAQPGGGMVMPPAFTLEPRRRRTTSGQPVRIPIATELAYGAACERVDVATDREQIADALVGYAKGRLDALVVFLIRDGNALGWRGYLATGSGAAAARLDELSLPLGGASALQSAHDAAHLYVGAPPSAAKPVESRLWSALGATPEPLEVAVVPVVVKQRTVNLIYAHVLGSLFPREIATELADLAARAAQSYMRLIRQTRGS
jgi:hypothetical protein